jgi:nicotinic acid mononucleotide adenylyltransferase
MLLRELYEAPKTAVLAFGRMNPPTIGHKKLADAVAAQDGDPYIFLSQNQKPKTDPLDFPTKVKLAQAFFPNVKVGDANVKTIIQALQKVESMGYTDIIYVAGSDRIEDFTTLINKYNGKEYNFNSIKVVSAGERDPDADGAEGMSASKMRAAAAAGDLESFAQGAPDKRLAKTMYDAVRKGMGVKDEQEVDEIWGFARQSNKRKTYKKKKEEPIEPSVQDRIAARRKAAAKGDKDAWSSKKEIPTDEAELNEAIPVAVLWIIKWAIRYGAWPVLKWLLKRHGGKIIGGAAVAYYIDQGWDWVKDKIGAEYAQMLIDNKFEIGMAVALIVGAVVLKKYIEKQGEKLVKANESMIEKAPPGREKQVKALKKKFDDPGAPYAIAWAQHNKKKK